MPRQVPLGDEVYLETSQKNPCPICGHKGYCLVLPDGSKAMCQFMTSDRRVGEAGYLHLIGAQVQAALVVRIKQDRATTPESRKFTMPELWDLYQQWVSAGRIGDVPELAASLGVPSAAIKGMGAVKCQNHPDLPYELSHSYAFPMASPFGEFCGLRLRCSVTKKKWAVKGSSNGLFIPANLGERARQLFCVEGPTDTAAGVAAGLTIVGRASCNTGAGELAVLCKKRGVQHLGFISDRDKPNPTTGLRPGWDWACRMRDDLMKRVPGLKAVAFLLPAKDLREFYKVQGPGTAAKVLDLYQNAGGVVPWKR
jgi:hypothetical protein